MSGAYHSDRHAGPPIYTVGQRVTVINDRYGRTKGRITALDTASGWASVEVAQPGGPVWHTPVRQLKPRRVRDEATF